jgi:hypothetical protein
MQTIVKKLQPAQDEVHRAAHDQDLVEVPKRATLDRENDGQMLNLPKLARTEKQRSSAKPEARYATANNPGRTSPALPSTM